MKRVYIAADAARAELIRSLLESAGIRAVIEGGALGAAVGEVPFVEAYPRISVDDADVDAARRLIVDSGIDGPTPARCRTCGYDLRGLSEPRCPECGSPFREERDAAPWTCPNCGEAHEGQFSACWQCGAARPEAPSADA